MEEALPLNIKDPEAHALARELARQANETITTAVKRAIRERLRRLEAGRRPESGLAERLQAIGRHCARLPVRRDRPPDEILGYDQRGLPR